jgi:hypothetical protein
VRRSTLILIALAFAGVVVAVMPFGGPAPRRVYTYNEFSSVTAGHCSAPIVSAWRDEPVDGGWVGYAPLTAISDQVPLEGLSLAFQSCAEPARQRLAISAVLAGPGILLFFLRRRRIDPPPDTRPNLAT